MQPLAPSLSTKRSRHKTFMLLGNVALFALSSGVAGMFVGALVGVANYFSGPTYISNGSGTLRATYWWEVVQFCTVANGTFMSLLGLLVGLVLFLFIGSTTSNWSPQHKERFFQGLKTRLFLPLALSIFLISLLIMALWCLWHGGMTSRSSDLGTIITFTGVGMLPVGACLWTFLLARSSKRTSPEKPISVGRLLPLD